MAAHLLEHWHLSALDQTEMGVMQQLAVLDYPAHPPGSQWTESMPAYMSGIHGGDRADVFSIELGGEHYCVKRFHDTRPLTLLRKKLGFSKASRAYGVAQKLMNRGVSVPPIIGLALHSKEATALFVTKMLGSGETVRDMFWQEAVDHEQLAQRCEAFTRSLAERGVVHLDYGPRNILHFEGELYLIDLEDVRFSTSKKNFERMTRQFQYRRDKDAARLDRHEGSGNRL